MSRPFARLCAALLTATLILVAAPASAHVTVSSPDAAAGGFGKVIFRVPTESETAATTKVRITLPADTPFAFVSAQTKPGWKLDVREAELSEPLDVEGSTITKAVRTVTWTATGDGIVPGEFDEFALSAGPFPEVRSLTFAAEQTYDDGEVVAWDEPAKDGAEEPAHPAPVLTLPAASDGKHTPASGDRTGGDTSDPIARGLGGAALVGAIAVAVMVLRENRRRD